MDAILEKFKVFLLETGQIQSEMTTESYLGNVKQLLVWLNEEQVELEKLDRMLMISYLEYLKDGQYRPNTYNTKINSLVKFSQYLKDKAIIEKDIVFGQDKIQHAGNREVEVYSDEEMELIEDYLVNGEISVRDRLIIQILKATGIRVSELTNLRLENIDLMGLEIEVSGKGNKRRVLPIKSNLASDIRSYISGERKANKHSRSPYLFVSERSNQLHRNTVLDITKNMGEKLSIEANNHKFRHTLATRMARNGNINLKVVQELLGHASIDTVFEYYISTSKEELRDALENI